MATAMTAARRDAHEHRATFCSCPPAWPNRCVLARSSRYWRRPTGLRTAAGRAGRLGRPGSHQPVWPAQHCAGQPEGPRGRRTGQPVRRTLPSVTTLPLNGACGAEGAGRYRGRAERTAPGRQRRCCGARPVPRWRCLRRDAARRGDGAPGGGRSGRPRPCATARRRGSAAISVGTVAAGRRRALCAAADGGDPQRDARAARHAVRKVRQVHQPGRWQRQRRGGRRRERLRRERGAGALLPCGRAARGGGASRAGSYCGRARPNRNVRRTCCRRRPLVARARTALARRRGRGHDQGHGHAAAPMERPRTTVAGVATVAKVMGMRESDVGWRRRTEGRCCGGGARPCFRGRTCAAAIAAGSAGAAEEE